MKVGAENKTKTFLAIALLVIAIGVLLWRMQSSSAPAAEAAAAVTQPATAARAAAKRTGENAPKTPAAVLKPTLDPKLRTDLLAYSENTKYEGAGRNIFHENAEPVIETPVKSPCKTKDCQTKPAAMAWTPPVPQGPPPINLKFYGWASKTGEAKRIFLTQGDDVFVAGEGDIVARRYKIVKINNNNVEIEDVLNNNRQTIPLTQG